ncbi:hypothetical protein OEA41_002360 [Lepraria neglecta]|uniref:Hepatocellular carcinoma-associated antigen 59-domain-containing protein n=1 Tax=Lepraria neglecta TaxID=209136 RepID=A0AAD9ZBG2_9LECA|nr:hypothetical protein OEA41_002360 [Lepraria neglecta]
MDTDIQNDGQTSSDLFRPAKRRKFYRKRTDTEDEDSPKAADSSMPPPEPMTVDELIAREGEIPAPQEQSEEDRQLSIADILRQRKAAQRRKGGIEFTNLNTSNTTTLQASDALIEKEDEIPADIKSVIERFAPQTGQITETTDKHIGQGLSPNGALVDAGIQRAPAALGKLHEIDLGPDATLRNIARTEAAQRKLGGAEPEIDEKTGKVPLRKDGKPYEWRKRRNSDDVKRDKLVEEVMRESRLEIYDEPDEDEGANGDQAADDRIAEQFRREFMDAISSRKQKAVQEKKPVKGKVVDDRPKGPKLGGSRSARAAMREKEEAAARKR